MSLRGLDSYEKIISSHQFLVLQSQLLCSNITVAFYLRFVIPICLRKALFLLLKLSIFVKGQILPIHWAAQICMAHY